jgi:hypothetical protein
LQISLDFKTSFIYNSLMMITLKNPKPRNLVSKDLRSPKYRMRVESSKKEYKRIPKRELMEMVYA